jgi:outer membrane biosynthesis protein TonB
MTSMTAETSRLVAALASALLAACSSTPPAKAPVPAADPPAVTTTAAEAEAPPTCDLVCEGAQVIAKGAQTPDYNQAAVEDANRKITEMHDDLLACYTKRLASKPTAHGFITVDIIVEADGHVRNVETTGGALLGEGAMACIVTRIKAATFAPVHGGGTQRIHIPFALRRVGPDDTI